MFRPSVRPLRHHLFQLTLLGLVPLAIFAALALAYAAQAHRAELERSTIDLSRAVASAVQSEFDGTLMSLAGLSRSSDLATGNIAAFHERAQRLMEIQPEWLAITLSDATGRMVFSSSYPFPAPSLEPADIDSLEAAVRTGEPLIGKATRGPNGRAAVAVRYPVADGAGKLRYVLSAAITPERLLSILLRQRVPDGWVIAILDHELQIFARSSRHADFLLRPATPGLMAMARSAAAEGTGVSLSQEGAQVVTGFSRTPEFGWTVAVGAPTTPLATFFTPTLALYMVGAVGSMLICVVLAMRLARRISTDIGGAADAAAVLGEGQPIDPASSRIAEIDRLGRALRDAGRRLHAAQSAQSAALDQAREAGRAKDEFLAMLGHELRNPLAPMVSAMYLLDARADPSSLRERTILRRQLDHMRRLVDDLLDVARLTRGKVQIQPRPMDLARELAAILDDLRQAQAPAASPIVLESDGEQAWVLGDARRLSQVFTNLLSNALRHGAGKPIRLRLEQLAERVRVTVEDDGEGMSRQTLGRIFEPFYQSPSRPDQPRGGLGLGLAVVKSIVEAHGGAVSAHSAGVGQGSRFEVVLPAVRHQDVADAIAAGAG
ncbi:sensor histidine kinase [Ramlibacter sp. AN1015]|uniref:cache domain-containing sensor histidine kinase n=1 Tax=Ramlibacter sp. AN1015 TaxID=3133428 RepID=UPI0030C001B6